MLLNGKAVLGTLGVLLVFLAGALVLPALVGVLYGEASWWTFLVTAVLSGGLGGAAWRYLKPEEELKIREGFAIVALAWVVLSLFGALPFVMSGVLDSYTDAFFETMSGFSTTGATILGGATTPAIEDLPHAFLFWRSLTHWLGGMGIIVLTIAILPMLGVGGYQLFRAEVPGPSTDKLTPRVRETAKRLWLIYVAFTAIQVVLLLPAMSFFDAVNHAFSTMATGGFSTQSNSVGQYESAYVDWVIIVFMFLAGVNFALHYRVLKGKPLMMFRSEEFRVYSVIVLVATALVMLVVFRPGGGQEGTLTYSSFGDALRFALFQVISIITTTGFGTADYELWPKFAMGVLFLLFFVGGMAGSTAGGIKVVRVVLLAKNSFRELKMLLHPRAILPVRLNHEVVPQEVMRNVLSFIVLYIGLIGFGTLTLTLLGIDLLGALEAAVSCVSNVGPGFGTFGPTENYAHVPALGKWVLSFLMVAGRLEIFTLLVLFIPAFWRR